MLQRIYKVHNLLKKLQNVNELLNKQPQRAKVIRETRNPLYHRLVVN